MTFNTNQIAAMTTWETEVDHLFDHHISDLMKQKWQIIDEISQWQKNTLFLINKYVQEQRDLLEKICESKITRLKRIRESFANEQMNDQEQIHQRMSQCSSWKVKLASLNYLEYPISTIQIVTEQQSNTNERHENAIDNEPPEQENTTVKTEIVKNETPTIVSIKEETTTVSSITTNSTLTDHPHNGTNDHEPKNTLQHQTVLLEKCPICCMIFSQRMSIQHRTIHVNEHYTE